jgi:hypothetical protein
MASAVTKAIVCASVSFGLGITALFVLLGAPHSEGGAAESAAALFIPILVAAVICAALAKKSKVEWSWPKFVGIFLMTVVAVQVVATSGRASKSVAQPDREPEVSSLLIADWPSDWIHTTESIKSHSAGQEQIIGTRDRLRKEDGAGVELITAACIEWIGMDDTPPDIDADTKRSEKNVAASFTKNGFTITTTSPRKALVGSYDALEYQLTGVNAQSQLSMNASVAFTPMCQLTVSYVSIDGDYERYLPAFARLKASIHEGPFSER